MRHLAVFWLACSILVASGCDDNTFRIDPLLVTDTVEVFAPVPQTADLPTALDITVGFGGDIQGGRFPERAADAGEWDFAVRLRDGGLALVPATLIGLESRAAITRPLLNQTFEGLVEAPGRTSFFTDSAVVLEVGRVYAARSRVTALGLSGCEQFAKLQPLEVDLAQGRVRLRITTNERCGDPRLALED